MKKGIRRNLSVLTKEEREKCVNDIISFFSNERNEEMGMIAAEEILDFFLENAGIDIYNRGIEDTKQFFQKRWEELDFEIDALKRQK